MGDVAALAAAVRRVRGELVTIEVGGRCRRVSYDEALLRVLRDYALMGDLRAQKLFEEISQRALANEAAALAQMQKAQDVWSPEFISKFTRFLIEEARRASPPATAGGLVADEIGAAGRRNPARAESEAQDSRLGSVRGGEAGLGVAAARGEAGAGRHSCGGSPERGHRTEEKSQKVTGAPALPPPMPQSETQPATPVRRRSSSGPLIESRPLTGVGWGVSGR